MNRERIYTIIQEMMAIDSPSGFTKNIIEYLENAVNALGFKNYRTNKGNLIVEVGQGDEGIGVCAHVDTLGFMVRSIKADGSLALTKVGGPLMPTVDGEYCKVYTRSGKTYTGTILSNSPSVHVYKDSSSLKREEDTMCVHLDEVVKSKDDVLKLGIQSGDFIAYDPKTVITESGFIKSRFLDDKLSVAILLYLLEEIKNGSVKPSQKLYFLISTYEEVGHGCAWIPSGIHTLLAVDMGCIGLDLNCSEYDVSICAKDASGPYDYDVTNTLIDLAKEHKLQYAVDIYPYYGSDVSAALRGGSNIRGALIGPGVANSHGMERSHIEAVENTFALLKYYFEGVK